MENLRILTLCDDSSCYCLSPRGTAVIISVIGLVSFPRSVIGHNPPRWPNADWQTSHTIENIMENSQFACLLDVLSNDSLEASCDEVREHLCTLRNLLLTLFQMSNILLLLGSIVESALLLQIYLWYMLAFIVIGFALAIAEFCFRVRDEGAWSFATFLPEVMLLFVLFRCLPLVDTYRKRLEGV